MVIQMHAITVASALGIATAPFMRHLIVRNAELSAQAPQAVSSVGTASASSPFRRRGSMSPMRVESSSRKQ